MRAFSFMRVYMSRKLKELEEQIGYTFQDPRLLRRAMMHSSYVNEKHLPKYECNERLEFLGDAVLELVSSEFLFHENEKMPEGELTKTRASMEGRGPDRRKREGLRHIGCHGGADRGYIFRWWFC